MIDGPSLMRWVVGYEGLYLIRNDGAVFNRQGREMAQRVDRYGYANVRLNRGGQSWKKVHRLVCEAWHGPSVDGHQAGAKHPSVKLSVEEVEAIRHSCLSSRTLAARYGVNQSQIVRIKNGTRWAEGIAQ